MADLTDSDRALDNSGGPRPANDLALTDPQLFHFGGTFHVEAELRNPTEWSVEGGLGVYVDGNRVRVHINTFDPGERRNTRLTVSKDSISIPAGGATVEVAPITVDGLGPIGPLQSVGIVTPAR